MTVLSLCKDAASAIGIPQPSTIIGNTQDLPRQLLVQAGIEGRELAKRHTWSDLVTEATFTTVAAESQGAFSSLGGGSADYSDFNRMIPGTFWNRTQNWPIYGPLSPSEWQAKKASNVAGPYNEYRIKGGALEMYPAPTAGHTAAFEYVSNNWCQSSGGTGQSAWAADTDTGVLDESLMMLGVVWRVKKALGFAYADEYEIYDQAVRKAINADGSRRTLNLGRRSRPMGAVIVPDGNWSP